MFRIDKLASELIYTDVAANGFLGRLLAQSALLQGMQEALDARSANDEMTGNGSCDLCNINRRLLILILVHTQVS